MCGGSLRAVPFSDSSLFDGGAPRQPFCNCFLILFLGTRCGVCARRTAYDIVVGRPFERRNRKTAGCVDPVAELRRVEPCPTYLVERGFSEQDGLRDCWLSWRSSRRRPASDDSCPAWFERRRIAHEESETAAPGHRHFQVFNERDCRTNQTCLTSARWNELVET